MQTNAASTLQGSQAQHLLQAMAREEKLSPGPAASVCTACQVLRALSQPGRFDTCTELFFFSFKRETRKAPVSICHQFMAVTQSAGLLWQSWHHVPMPHSGCCLLSQEASPAEPSSCPHMQWEGFLKKCFLSLCTIEVLLLRLTFSGSAAPY